jgi:hypothetical protein
MITPFVIARHNSAEAISVGQWRLPRFAHNDTVTCHCEGLLPFFITARLAKPAEAISGTMEAVSKQYYCLHYDQMTNIRNTVLYVGVTNDLIRRAYEHREKMANGFPENTTSLNLYITRFFRT